MNILKKNALSWLFYYTLWRIFQEIIFTKYFQEIGSSYIYLDLIKAIILAVWETKIFEFTKEGCVFKYWVAVSNAWYVNLYGME